MQTSCWFPFFPQPQYNFVITAYLHLFDALYAVFFLLCDTLLPLLSRQLLNGLLTPEVGKAEKTEESQAHLDTVARFKATKVRVLHVCFPFPICMTIREYDLCVI